MFARLLCLLPLLFCACAYNIQNQNFENALVQKFCDDAFFQKNLSKVKANNDPIYHGLNAGLIARNCSNFTMSNTFFDHVEESYKEDVDLQNSLKKGTRLTTAILINDEILDYQGSLYERIMVNAYKGLNFMHLGDYANARVEFNRVLLRQERAKEYFASAINAVRKEVQEDPHMRTSVASITREYDRLFETFKTTEDFTNPYATYLASVFFLLDADYRRASDLFREIVIANPQNQEIQKQFLVFERRANAIGGKQKSYVFVVYENGMGVIKDSFELTLSFGVENQVIATSVALQTLQEREGSFPFLDVNGIKTEQIVNLDSIVATEFRINLPLLAARAAAQTLTKTTINLALANSDSSGLLSAAGSLFSLTTTKADVRSWMGLPKIISVAMVENTGEISIKDSMGSEIFKGVLQEDKDALVIVRSFAIYLPSHVEKIQK